MSDDPADLLPPDPEQAFTAIRELSASLAISSDNRRLELEVQAENNRNLAAFSNRQLDAHVQDRREERELDWRKARFRYWIGAGVFATVAFAFLLLVLNGYGDTVIESLKYLLGIGAGFGIGVLYGFRVALKRADEHQES